MQLIAGDMFGTDEADLLVAGIGTHLDDPAVGGLWALDGGTGELVEAIPTNVTGIASGPLFGDDVDRVLAVVDDGYYGHGDFVPALLDGTFPPSFDLPIGADFPFPSAGRDVDVDGDGTIDFSTGARCPEECGHYLGLVGRSFPGGVPSAFGIGATGYYAGSVTADLEGRPRVIAAGGGTLLLAHAVTGAVGSMTEVVGIPVPETRYLSSGDFDGDGIVDLAVPGKGVVGILYRDGVGELSGCWRAYEAPYSYQLTAGDLDGDGIDDLLVGTRWTDDPSQSKHPAAVLLRPG